MAAHDSDDWDDLSVDYMRQSVQNHHKQENRHHCPKDGASTTKTTTHVSESNSLIEAVSRTVLKPLCLCVNQKNTRVGVGHEGGFLVFKVTEHKADTKMADASEEDGDSSALQLVLDPTYNTDGASYSEIHRRIRAHISLAASRHAGDEAISSFATMSAPLPEEEEDSSSNGTLASTLLGDDHLEMFLSYSHFGKHRQKSNRSAPKHTETLMWGDDDDGDEEVCSADRSGMGDKMGYASGGVAVMALLYEQPSCAIVGGGPTPIGTPREVKLLNSGHHINSITVAHPVTRLFMDGRLLFILTTAEFIIYTNPMESEWTACAYRSSLLPPVSPALTPSGSGAAFGPSPAAVGLEHSLTSSGSVLVSKESSMLFENTPNASTEEGSSIPPCTVDYARSLVLLPAAQSPCGFRILKYALTTQPNSQVHTDPTASVIHGAVPSGLCVQELVAIPKAHKNPISGLAMYVGPVPTGLCNNNTVASPTTTGAETVLVAACSEYATRISLWVLALSNAPTPEQMHLPTVPLKEFRVGVKIPARLSYFNALGRAAAGSATSGSCGGGALSRNQKIDHLQFLHDGRFILCVHDGSMKVYSTIEETSLETKNVCQDHPQAVQNSHSMLASVARYVPQSLNLDAYTRQMWASCQALLPIQDSVFYPAWLSVCKQDEAAEMTTRGRSWREQLSGGVGRQNSHTELPAMKQSWVGGLFGSLVKATATWSTAHPGSSLLGDDGTDKDKKIAMVSPFPKARTQLAACILMWERNGTNFSHNNGSIAPVVNVDCVTCDGAAMGMQLLTDSGQLRFSPAVPYMLQ